MNTNLFSKILNKHHSKMFDVDEYEWDVQNLPPQKTPDWAAFFRYWMESI